MVVDVGVNIVTIQVLRQVDKLLDAARVVADLHGRLEPLIFILAHVVQLGSQIVQLLSLIHIFESGARRARRPQDRPASGTSQNTAGGKEI